MRDDFHWFPLMVGYRLAERPLVYITVNRYARLRRAPVTLSLFQSANNFLILRIVAHESNRLVTLQRGGVRKTFINAQSAELSAISSGHLWRRKPRPNNESAGAFRRRLPSPG